jgi:hypothetical protein
MRGSILNDRPFRAGPQVPDRFRQSAPSVVGKGLADQAEQAAEKYQKLSLSESGKFDTKFHILGDGGSVVGRTLQTNWDRVCRQRATTGVSRKARIKAKKTASTVEVTDGSEG